MVKTTNELTKKLNQFKKSIINKYTVKRIILFGSRATGTAKKHSDVDLIIVSKKFKGREGLKAASSLYEDWHLRQKIGLPVDFLCYSPDEFKRLSNRISIVSQAIKEGIEI
ncbi:nucleotidyltransferase domain-containing protein [Candidatus Woesearchaeota archaeon]|nr:nucleotidyltransferase domain-containing protein [Candidatus Woesearchaeota archaeon]